MSDALTSGLTDLLGRHRSIRRYKPDPIDPVLVEDVCRQAIAGTSSSGNLNLVSIVLTEDPARKEALYKLHFEQPMILQAPLLVTFCADTNRTRRWLKLREARDNFNNFKSFMVGAIDAAITAQSAALGFQARGLGICYMGTTLMSCVEIADFLELPETCVPITTLVVGYPDEDPANRDRLPLRSFIHRERYQAPSDEQLLSLYADREIKGWERYRNALPEVMVEAEKRGITSLAQFYTSDLKYAPGPFQEMSRKLERLLAEKQFMEPRADGGQAEG
ncbi:MAG TPA: nitroreductase family protein [Aliidongia sp.]|nr:nitroreductase family protein [Aliidongia sp.]